MISPVRLIRLSAVLVLLLAVSSACGEVNGSVLDSDGEEPSASAGASGSVNGSVSAPRSQPAGLDGILREGATPVVRTDFTDDAAWKRVLAAIGQPDEYGNAPWIEPVDDPAYTSVTGKELARQLSGSDATGYAILVDARSMRQAADGREPTVGYVDLSSFAKDDAEAFRTFPGRTFRCSATQVASIEVNLSLANMDFADFADAVEKDGVFRGEFDEG
jgi:hypothetical protein